MYSFYTQDELRLICRQNIENFEIWARNFIHEKMNAKYGPDYINYKFPDGNYLIKKEVRQHVSDMLKKNPERFNRAVDTLFVDHIIYFLCHDKLYPTLFKDALDESYPDGKKEVRTMLSRLIPIRNPLSHSNPISMHQAEQAICYTHDFIEGLKIYYKKKGKEKVWNVPKIIKVKDSLGNVFTNFKDESVCVITIPQVMNIGDFYSIEIEIDPSFRKDDYKIVWDNNNIKDTSNKTKFDITFTSRDVSESKTIQCYLVQNKNWHKYTYYDFRILIIITVLPPRDEQ